MNPIAITVVVAVALLFMLAMAASRQRSQIGDIRDVDARWQAVDMEAFLNLVDPAEERYLRRELPAGEFSRIQRMRVRVMWEYLGRLAFNSKLMMQAAQLVQHNSTGEKLQEATQLVATASRMRMLIFAADAYLAVRFLLPHKQDPIRGLVAQYESLTQSFAATCASGARPFLVTD